MGGHKTYEESIKSVYKGLVLLAVVTLIEVFLSLLGKGHIIAGAEKYQWLFYVVGFGLIALSLYKAYFIIYEFMHLRYEVKGMAMSILLPVVLLVWAVIAFFQEGTAWKGNRARVQEFNQRAPASDVDDDAVGEVYELKELDTPGK